MSDFAPPLVGLVMGSVSDWDTVRHTADTLNILHVNFEARIVSAHRTPDLLYDYASTAHQRGIQVIIAAAGGAAHLPGMMAAKSVLPVIGVPVESHALHGVDSLLSIVQMPGGVPVATMAIGRPGAVNAALHAASILALSNPILSESLRRYREDQTAQVMSTSVPGFLSTGEADFPDGAG